jgi:hypothetical protein
MYIVYGALPPPPVDRPFHARRCSLATSQSDFDKQVQREDDIAKVQGSTDPIYAATQIMPEAAALYKKHDYSLKEGENIK